MSYTVRWEADFDAGSTMEAVNMALSKLRSPGQLEVEFSVRWNDKEVLDLTEAIALLKEESRLWNTK